MVAMDADPPLPGYSSVNTVIELGAAPLSFWLRLAHRWPFAELAADVQVRRITDWMLLLQMESDTWVWWEPAGGSLPLPAGSVLIVPPGVRHGVAVGGSHYAVHFDLIADPSVEPMAMLRPERRLERAKPLAEMPAITIRHERAGDALVLPVVTRLDAPEVWIERCEQLSLLYRTHRHRGLAASCQAAEILSWAVRTLAGAHRPRAADDAAVARVLEAAARLAGPDLARPWSLSSLARQAGMGRTAFWDVFTATIGMTPRAFLTARRLEVACLLLQDTAVPVRAVAAEIGFPDAFHFSRVFKREMGVSPRAWRLGNRPTNSKRAAR